MSREIKFRAWNSEKEEMFQANALYLKGCYASRFTNYEEDTAVEIGPDDNGEKEAYELATIIMQYTGLKDKNGKEIWEGDIVRFQPIAKVAEIYEVRWGHFGFTYWSEATPDGNHYLQGEYVEVIGNIMENKELL